MVAVKLTAPEQMKVDAAKQMEVAAVEWVEVAFVKQMAREQMKLAAAAAVE